MKTNLPFFRLPPEQDLLLFLIQKELQGTRFTNELEQAGFDTSRYHPDLGAVILSLLGHSERTDALWAWYFEIVEGAAERVDLSSPETAQVAAIEVLQQLTKGY